MADRIQGTVIEIIDGDTFDVEVSEVLDTNEYEYHDVERVRLEGVDAPEIDDPGGEEAAEELEKAILDEMVEITVYSRDTFGRLVGAVKVLD